MNDFLNNYCCNGSLRGSIIVIILIKNIINYIGLVPGEYKLDYQHVYDTLKKAENILIRKWLESHSSTDDKTQCSFVESNNIRFEVQVM